MFVTGRVDAAIIVAVALVVCRVDPAATQVRLADEEPRTLLFSGRDLWRNGLFAYGGLLLAPGGVDQDGFNLKLLMSGGLYRYTGGSLAGDPPGSLAGSQIVGLETTVQVLPGFRVKRGDLEVKVFLGLDIENHWLDPDDPSNRLRGHSWGLRFAGEFWYEPTSTTMAAGDATLASAASNYAARLAYGWRMLDRFYLGPEVQYYGGDGYRQVRLGGHLTALKTGANEWTIAAGWARESMGQSSAYARLTMTLRQ